MSYAEALEKWEQMKATRFPDDEIKNAIYSGRQYSGTDVSSEEYAQSCFQQAMAMIAYNKMIDRRIENARDSWWRK